MSRGLVRYHESGQSHFLTFSCYRRKPKFADTRFYDLFPLCLEAMRLRFRMRIYGYVIMPEHVHLLVSEPEHGNLAEAMHYLKLSFSKRAKSLTGSQVSVQTKDANLGHQARRAEALLVMTRTKDVWRHDQGRALAHVPRNAKIFGIRANSRSFDCASARRKGRGGKEKARTLRSG